MVKVSSSMRKGLDGGCRRVTPTAAAARSLDRLAQLESIDAEVLDVWVTVREGTPLAQMLGMTLSLQIRVLLRHFEADVDSLFWDLDRVIATRAQSGTAVPAPLVHTAQQAPAGRVDLSVRTGTRDEEAVRDARGLRRRSG